MVYINRNKWHHCLLTGLSDSYQQADKIVVNKIRVKKCKPSTHPILFNVSFFFICYDIAYYQSLSHGCYLINHEIHSYFPFY
ncbi:hypothetical protein AB204_04560 [Xenorhabdus khoisanae]|uniref:Uncharacterized protein n=1 Tax=Xenorhabdus khoisanae TaxID=880157 RepID=A0A0J5FVK9_9GAMM|nr:hypothetical protein AB204_04560 [Xenorhabdus khoisanae]